MDEPVILTADQLKNEKERTDSKFRYTLHQMNLNKSAYLLVAPFFSLSAVQSSTLCVCVTGFIWLVQLYRLCRPLTAMRRWLCILGVGFTAGR